jgi:hypothetical protein
MWIEVHEGLPSHPKTLKLSSLTGYEIDRCVGKLVILWLWVGKQKEDGDISGVDPITIGKAAEIENPEEAKRFYKALIECRFVDEGVFLIHDWLDYVGRYLKSKYHTSNPAKWAKILKKHSGKPKGRLKAHIPKPKPIPLPKPKKDTQTVEDSRTGDAKQLSDQIRETHRTVKDPRVADKAKQLFDQFWVSYPKKRSKGRAEKAFQKIHPDEQLLARMISSIGRAKTSEEWKKENGRFIPHPATWLNDKGWEDEFDGKDNGSGGAGKKSKYAGIGVTVEAES